MLLKKLLYHVEKKQYFKTYNKIYSFFKLSFVSDTALNLNNNKKISAPAQYEPHNLITAIAYSF